MQLLLFIYFKHYNKIKDYKVDHRAKYMVHLKSGIQIFIHLCVCGRGIEIRILGGQDTHFLPIFLASLVPYLQF